MPTPSENVKMIQEKIQAICSKRGRLPSEVTTIAVTKGVSVDLIKSAFQAGLSIFGENRVQEAQEKIKAIQGGIHWHFIGHLQTNKVKDAVSLFEMIQSVDSLRLAQKLNEISAQRGHPLQILLEINIGQELNKCGVLETELDGILKEIKKLSHLDLRGLMTVAPFFENPEDVRPYFKKMKILFDRLEKPEILSMGMSHDFEIAIEEGTTMIRLGQAIFGPRS